MLARSSLLRLLHLNGQDTNLPFCGMRYLSYLVRLLKSNFIHLMVKVASITNMVTIIKSTPFLCRRRYDEHG